MQAFSDWVKAVKSTSLPFLAILSTAAAQGQVGKQKPCKGTLSVRSLPAGQEPPDGIHGLGYAPGRWVCVHHGAETSGPVRVSGEGTRCPCSAG